MRPDSLGYTLRRAALAGISIAAFVAAITATSAALEGFADAGITGADPSDVLTSVSPTGFAWQYGIRAGQRVVSIDDSLSPGGWRIETADSTGRHFEARSIGSDQGLRDSLPLGIGSMVLGALAVLFVRTHRRWVAPLACLALVGAAVPLSIEGDPALSTLSMAAAGLAPPIWFATRAWVGRLGSLVAVAGVLAFGAFWAAARLSGASTASQLEDIRGLLAGYGSIGVVMATTLVPVLRGEPISVTRPKLGELVAIALIGGLAVSLIFFFSVPPAAVALGIALGAIALPGLRRFASRGLEQALLADVRGHAALEAAEAERGRMARELHDAPLQQLAGVIQRLELVPEARAENEQLRAVANELRSVATDLRPPVLDDLGLAAGLEFLAQESGTAELPVVSDISDETGVDPDERPPSSVELAMFRIAQEAVGNAIRHARASRITIEGEVRRDRVDVAVVDDGIGLRGDIGQRATRRGRLGLASMRRRAEAIDADLAIDGSSTGTTVRVRWQR